MGWFWADTAASPMTPPYPIPAAGASPPPGCPMHKSSNSPFTSPTTAPKSSTAPGACPVVHKKSSPTSTTPPSDAITPPSSQSTPSYISALNPLNYMPKSISNTRDTTHQTIDLPLSRETSTIPKGDGAGNWEYPSPQQMYNAMLRKGYTDTPQDAVESMVAVHNFLNEGAWEEIVGWERRFAAGLGQGWDFCKMGEERGGILAEVTARRRAMETGIPREESDPRLMRFMGRPDELTPRARMLQFLGWAYPAKYNSAPPFDRHDWFVQRRLPSGETKELRYVIDYYAGPPEPTGEPVFYLDVRPAVDTPTQAVERVLRWSGDVWWRASGGVVRETEKMKERAQR